MISAIILSTYVLENYGDAEKPWWKPKGGNEYWLCKLEHEDGELDANMLLNGFGELIAKHITRDSTAFIEMVDNVYALSVTEALKRTEDDYDPLIATKTYNHIYRRN